MQTTLSGRAFLALLACGALERHASAQPPRLAMLESCRVPGVEEPVRCGHLVVPENRAAAGGRTISLNVVVLPATTDSSAPDPLVFLAGGGVVPATRYARFFATAFATLRRHRDVVLVDQRGTWGSNPLACPPPDGGGGDPLQAVRRCRDTLSRRADLSSYTTPSAVADLEAVRSWLGYSRLNLFGASYGTRVAQVYLHEHPGRVRTVTLHGVVPLDRSIPMQLDLARSAQTTLDAVFERCANEPDCRAAFPNGRAELDTVLARLTASPASVTLDSSATDRLPLFVDDRVVRNFVQASLASLQTIRPLPMLIHTAYEGDLRPLARRLVPPSTPPPPPAPLGVFLSILCSEGIPVVDPSRIDDATRGTFFGDAPVRFQMGQCTEWTRAPMPDWFGQPVRSPVPALVMSGDLDSITPPRYGEAVTRALANGRHLLRPSRSHSDTDPCVTSLIEQFVIAGSSATLDESCLQKVTPVGFVGTRSNPELSSRTSEASVGTYSPGARSKPRGRDSRSRHSRRSVRDDSAGVLTGVES